MVTSRPSARRAGVVAALSSLVLGLLLAVAPAASADPAPEGRYISFRTGDTGNEPGAEVKKRCRDRLGVIAGALVAIELDAELFSYTTDPATSVVVDETRRKLGTGYLCVSADITQLVTEQSLGGPAYAELTLPGIGRLSAGGRCTLLLSGAQPGATFANCRLTIDANPSTNVTGGVINSNSIANPLNVAGNTTGSIWTAYLERSSWAPTAPVGPTPEVPGNTTAVDGTPAKYVVASASATTPKTSCWGTTTAYTLGRIEPGESTGELAAGAGSGQVGRVELCSYPWLNNSRKVSGSVQVTGPAGRPATLSVNGTCFDTKVVGARTLELCSLEASGDSANGVRGGLVTSIGPRSGGNPIFTVTMIPTA